MRGSRSSHRPASYKQVMRYVLRNMRPEAAACHDAEQDVIEVKAIKVKQQSEGRFPKDRQVEGRRGEIRIITFAYTHNKTIRQNIEDTKG